MMIYTKASFRRKKKKSKFPKAKKLSRSVLEKITTAELPKYREIDRSIPSLSTSTKFQSYTKSMMDPVSLAKEPESVREAIIAKSKRIAIAYSKGAYQYISDDIDVRTIGRKNTV